MTWYDTNLNPIEPPTNTNDNKTYIFIQKPHARTLRLFFSKIVYRKFELPWMVFCYRNERLYVSISKEMPTLGSQLYIPYFSPTSVCIYRIFNYYPSIITPQDYIDYFWSSAFKAEDEDIDVYLKDPSKYILSLCPDIKKLTYFAETGIC